MKKTWLLTLFACLGLGVCSAQLPRKPAAKEPVPLRDGTLYSGIEGVVTGDPNNQTCFFTATTDVSDGFATVAAGRPIEMLPCSTLEKIVGTFGKNQSVNGRLWARVTRYSNLNVLTGELPSRKFPNRRVAGKNAENSRFLNDHLTNKNFLFAIYFIPMTPDAAPDPPANTVRPGQAETREPTNDDVIPAEILEKLEGKRVVDLKKMREMLATEGDVVLADRVGFVDIDGPTKTFKVDSLGRNVEDLEFALLSCEALEFTEKSLVDTPTVRQRFRVSGIVTTFRGKTYMLLQRAVRTYSHGNFAR